ncbi:MAG: DinB family protein [Fimbriimonadales bacterium]
MQTMSITETIISEAKAHTERNCAQFLHTFSFVPDDKLSWSPSATSKSALQIAAHLAVSNFGISSVIRGEGSGDMPMEELMKHMAEQEAALTTREAVIAAINESTKVVIASLDSINDSNIDAMLASPFGEFPAKFWMFLPGNHMMGHAYQVDYIQTIYGDVDFHFVSM